MVCMWVEYIQNVQVTLCQFFSNSIKAKCKFFFYSLHIKAAKTIAIYPQLHYNYQLKVIKHQRERERKAKAGL